MEDSNVATEDLDSELEEIIMGVPNLGTTEFEQDDILEEGLPLADPTKPLRMLPDLN